MITFLAIVVLIVTFELWLPLAFLFGAIRLLATFSVGSAWEAMKSVPMWVWDFTHSVLS
jgi:hypothetical protein